jgi:hypothetical protein
MRGEDGLNRYGCVENAPTIHCDNLGLATSSLGIRWNPNTGFLRVLGRG